jgi:hypothetical protein
MPRRHAYTTPLSDLLHSLDVRLQPLADGWAIDLTLPERARLCSGNGEPLPATPCAGAATHRLLLLMEALPLSMKPTPHAASPRGLSRRAVVKRRSARAGKR